MKILNYNISKPGSEVNIITCASCTQLKKTQFEVILWNKAKEDPFRMVVKVENRAKYLQPKADTRQLMTIARETADLFYRRNIVKIIPNF